MANPPTPKQKMFGKQPAKIDSRTLNFSAFMPMPLRPPPLARHWEGCKAINAWGMDGNDIYGNCVVVTTAHILDCAREWESGIHTRLTDERVVQESNHIGALHGYSLLDRLKLWKRSGLFGTKIEAYVEVKRNSLELVKAAINIFGHCDIGIYMAPAWDTSPIWDIGEGPAYAKDMHRGHSVPIFGYEERRVDLPGRRVETIFHVCSWGKIFELTGSAFLKYCDEAYASLVPDWWKEDRVTSSGFKYEELLDAAQVLACQ